MLDLAQQAALTSVFLFPFFLQSFFKPGEQHRKYERLPWSQAALVAGNDGGHEENSRKQHQDAWEDEPKQSHFDMYDF